VTDEGLGKVQYVNFKQRNQINDKFTADTNQLFDALVRNETRR
jgi:hypothetical protein